MLLIIYWVMTLCCCLYAAIAGGRAGRVSAALITFITIAGFYAALMAQRSWGHTVYPLLALDMLCLIAFLMIALRSDRWWPLWTTACALATVTTHLASIAQLGISPAVYHGLKGLWAVPMQLFMVRGIVLDGRYRRSLELREATYAAPSTIWKNRWRR